MVSNESMAAMEATKLAVRDFMIKNGQHDTTVHEKVNPAVYHETVTRTEHEHVVTAIDRESHIDHYHTSVQPIVDSETLEEQHQSHILPTEKRTYEHDDREEVQRRLDVEQAKFRDKVQRIEGEHTREVVPVANSEHIHHHVHEIIQPVVNKQVLQPVTVHTVQLFHEVHHQAAQHHSTSALPVVSMADFLKQGGVLTSREERYDWFQGEPRSVGGTVGNVNIASGGPPAQTSTQGAQGQGAQAGAVPSTENKDASVPTTTTTVAPAPPSTPAAASASTTAPIAPPERRSSLPANDRPGSPTSNPGSTSNAANPSAGTNPNASLGPNAGPSGPSQSSQPAPGRWSLLPMRFARSDADASRAGAHPPTRATAHASSVMPPMHPAHARADQEQHQQPQSQRQASVSKPLPEQRKYPADK